MPDPFHYVPHPRLQERRTHRPVKVKDQLALDSPNVLVRLNARLGLAITLVVGTMWCAYVFAAIALISLPNAITSHNLVIIVAWISSNFLQLVLLPIIIVGQNLQAKASDKRAEETYRDAEVVLHEAAQIQAHLVAQDEAIASIIERLQALPSAS